MITRHTITVTIDIETDPPPGIIYSHQNILDLFIDYALEQYDAAAFADTLTTSEIDPEYVDLTVHNVER